MDPSSSCFLEDEPVGSATSKPFSLGNTQIEKRLLLKEVAEQNIWVFRGEGLGRDLKFGNELGRNRLLAYILRKEHGMPSPIPT